MAQTTDTTPLYEPGVFRLLEPLPLPEHTHVLVSFVVPNQAPNTDDERPASAGSNAPQDQA